MARMSSSPMVGALAASISFFFFFSLSVSGQTRANPAPPPADVAKPVTIAMTAARWTTRENAEFLKQLGFYHGLMRLNSGHATLKDLIFENGTIEFDVQTIGRGAPGIAFRQQDDANFELLYLRPEPACPAFRACMQYAPQTRGILLWDLFPHYQTRAPIREAGWNHIRMVVSGRRMRVFVNDAPAPTLDVGRLEGDAMRGGLRLQGPATFANLVITPDAVDSLPPEAVPDPSEADRRLLRQWRLSPAAALPSGTTPTYAEMPAGSPAWRTIDAERGGLINLSRIYGRPASEPDRALAWVKTIVTSDKPQLKTVDLGWTREVWVFVNGQLVFTDKNLFEQESARKFPDGRCSLDNGTVALPLQAGENEVAVAIANNFAGWGMMMRLADLEGISLVSTLPVASKIPVRSDR